jgi:hypothetical protein
MKINKDGKEIEVFTQEELDAKVKAAKEEAVKTATEAASKIAEEKANVAIEAYKQSNPDKTAEIDSLKDKLAEAEAKLQQAQSYGGDGNRDEQIERLRKERDDAISALTKKVEDLTKIIEAGNKSTIDNTKNNLLDHYTKDPEQRKKLEFEFDNYRANDTTPAGMAERMAKAATLAGIEKKEQPAIMDNLGGAGGNKGGANYQQNVKTATPNAVAIGKALGVSEEDINKHLESKNGGNK